LPPTQKKIASNPGLKPLRLPRAPRCHRSKHLLHSTFDSRKSKKGEKLRETKKNQTIILIAQQKWKIGLAAPMIE